MQTYLVVNSLVSLLAIAVLKTIPASVNARYYLALFSLSVWALPHAWLSSLAPQTVTVEANWILPLASFESGSLDSLSSDKSAPSIGLAQVFLMLIITGGAIFITRLTKQKFWLRSLKLERSFNDLSELYPDLNTPVYASEKVNVAFISGFFKPVIWLSSKHVDSEFFDIIKTHETQHIKSNDQWSILMLELFRSLFWWNPLVLLLVKETHFLVELRCDLKASQNFPAGYYLERLAELVLISHTHTKHHFIRASIANKNFNLKRIRQIKGNCKMKLKSKLIYSIASFFLASIMLLPVVDVQAEKKAQQLPMEQQGLSMNFQQIPLEKFFNIIANYLQIENVEVEKGIAEVPVNIFIEKLPNEQIFSTLSKQLNVRIKNKDNTLKVYAFNGGIKSDVRFGEKPDAKTHGALLEFNVTRLKKNGAQMNTKTSAFSIWSEFDKQAFVKLGENWQMALKIDELDESFLLSTEIFTSSDSPKMKVLASPKLMITPGKQATIEWKNESDEQTITIDINAVRSLRPGARNGS